jgi:hypothetical protein
VKGPRLRAAGWDGVDPIHWLASQGYLGDACERIDDVNCLAACSGRGECIRGFCHCRPPYYGLGCLKGGLQLQGSVTAQQQQQEQGGHYGLIQQGHDEPKARPRSLSRLKVYMYDLPWQVAFQDGYFPGEPRRGAGSCTTALLVRTALRWLLRRSAACYESRRPRMQAGAATIPAPSPSGPLLTSWPRTTRWVGGPHPRAFHSTCMLQERCCADVTFSAACIHAQ